MSLIRRYRDRFLGRRDRSVPSSAEFVLRFQPVGQDVPVTVGFLRWDGEYWEFEYSPEYRGRTDLRPLEGLGDRDRTYRSKLLFPFFAVRIPDEHRPDVQRQLAEEEVEQPTLVDMLRIFGRRAVSSPSFELEPLTT